jgi:uncharacterized protein (DUF2147 family)
MKIFFTSIMFLVFYQLHGQFTGIWKNIDDEDGKAKSHIEVSENKGIYTATIIKLLPAATIRHCKKCGDDKKGRSLEGMDIVWDMKQESKKKLTGGRILNPKNGKDYQCAMELDGNDILKVRGYLGTELLGQTQLWYRVK